MDYSKSAINLCNPEAVGEQLLYLRQLEASLAEREAELNQQLSGNPLFLSIQASQEEIKVNKENLRLAIDKLGSFQDEKNGLYGIKQRRQSITYLPEVVKARLAKWTDALIKEHVDVDAMKGLIKGKLITEEESLKCADVEITSAFIIKV